MKRITFITGLFILCIYQTTSAQTFDDYKKQISQKFEQHKTEQRKKYNAYRDSLNKAFAEYMRKPWVKHTVKPAIPVPSKPKPTTPPVAELPGKGLNIPKGKELKPSGIANVPNNIPTPEVKRPDVKPINIKPTDSGFKFNYYGTNCALSLKDSHRFSLKGIYENHVADAWEVLSKPHYDIIIEECLAWKNKLNMCDWGYVTFIKNACNTFFGPTKRNESKLMQMFLLTHSGYMVRMGRIDQQLVILLPSEESIFQYPYFPVDGYKYYMYDKDCSGSCYLLEYKIPREKNVNFHLTGEQEFAYAPTPKRTFTSERYPNVSVTVEENKNLIDFFSTYPLGNTKTVYAKCAMSADAKEQLYPALRNAIAGKSEAEAANILLNFVQTAFQYKTDGEQFGIEKPMFTDEMLYYPYCDCEDRSFLYSTLMHDLMGLDVVLLEYPRHLATAVAFKDETITGPHYVINGKKYFVCDPTYIGAEICRVMPMYENTNAKIIKLK